MTALVLKTAMIIAAGSMVVVSLTFARPGNAGSHGTCVKFSKQAVRQQRINLSVECGFTGPRWHQRLRVHYQWCRAAPVFRIKQERDFRRSEIKRCVAEKAGKPATTD